MSDLFDLDALQQTLTGPLWLFLFVFTVFNVSWIVLYILVIRRGFIDKSFGIPFVALALNMSWDIVGATVALGPPQQSVADMFYYALQLVILYQVVAYGWKDFQEQMGKNEFVFWVGFTQVIAVPLMIISMIELRDPVGVEMGFVDTFINAALFIAMFYRRADLAGQSIYIGLLKLIGTGTMSAALTIYPWAGYEDSVILVPLYLGIFVLDLIYVVLVYRKAKRLGIDVWRRF